MKDKWTRLLIIYTTWTVFQKRQHCDNSFMLPLLSFWKGQKYKQRFGWTLCFSRCHCNSFTVVTVLLMYIDIYESNVWIGWTLESFILDAQMHSQSGFMSKSLSFQLENSSKNCWFWKTETLCCICFHFSSIQTCKSGHTANISLLYLFWRKGHKLVILLLLCFFVFFSFVWFGFLKILHLKQCVTYRQGRCYSVNTRSYTICLTSHVAAQRE